MSVHARGMSLLFCALSLLTIGAVANRQPAREAPRTSKVSKTSEVLARFEKGDPGWKVRMQSLVQLARAGSSVVPTLVKALKHNSPTTREFAAQALAMFAEPAARQALQRSLKDSYSRVRLYAARALSMLGPLEPVRRYEEIAVTDSSYFGVRQMIVSALERQDAPKAEALRKAWAGYDPAQIGSAHVGGSAPDFSLTGYSGKTWRLSQFRGKTVVLHYFLFDY